MCALQFASQNEQTAIDKDNLNEDVEERLKAMNQLLKAHLSA